MDNEAIKQHEMASMLCVSVRTVSRLCAKLTADGKLSRKGSDWVLRNEVALKNGVVGVSNGVVGVAHERKNDAKGRKMAVRSEEIARLRVALKDALKCNDEKIIAKYSEILALIEKEPHCTFSAICSAIGMSRRSVAGYMDTLQSNGVIKRIGSRKTGHWEICNQPDAQSSGSCPK